MEYENYNEELIGKVYYSMKHFLFHSEAFRTINKRIDCLLGDREFWVYTNDAHLKSAVMIWCKLFGIKKEETHWQRLFSNKICDAQTLRFYELLEEKGISREQFEQFSNDMRTFRNKYVAHQNDYNKPVPILDIAYEAVFALDKLIRESPYTFTDDKFELMVDGYRMQIKGTIDTLTLTE